MSLISTPPPSIEALLYRAQMEGVLPLTSLCNMRCAFCSNAYNPKGCEVFTIPPRPFEEIEASLLWLVGSRGPIVIGESVTRINEGEPLTHPDFMKILRLLRARYKDRGIMVTTNASLLFPDQIKQMADLDVELVVSLNTVGFRGEIMGDEQPERTLHNVSSLGEKVKFEGSIVALPFVTGWEDIRDTAKFLKDSGAWALRILSPGFSQFHPLYKESVSVPRKEMRDFSQAIQNELKIPVLFEPPGVTQVVPVVEYVLPGFPAKKAGIRQGDVITQVSGRDVMSRREAFELIRDTESPKVAYNRQGVLYETVVRKPKFSTAGLVMHDDLDAVSWFDWERKSYVKRRRVLVLTSAPAKPIIEDALRIRGLTASVVAVSSHFFGGNIEAGGLLTVRDFLAAYHDVRGEKGNVDLITLPKRAFDPWGRDLAGISYKAIEEAAEKPVILA